MKAITIAIGSALLALGSTPLSAQISDDVIKIGVLTDMAGVTADITGKGSVLAAELAVKEFGDAVLGKPIQIISADHQHKADVGGAIARQWFDVDKVDAIVDVPNSAVALAVQSLARDKKRIVMYSGAGTTAPDQRAMLTVWLPLDLRYLCRVARHGLCSRQGRRCILVYARLGLRLRTSIAEGRNRGRGG